MLLRLIPSKMAHNKLIFILLKFIVDYGSIFEYVEIKFQRDTIFKAVVYFKLVIVLAEYCRFVYSVLYLNIIPKALEI